MKARDKRQLGRQQRRRAEKQSLDALSVLERQRAPFGAQIERIIQAVFSRFSIATAGGLPILELGAGGGQLFRWLPESARSRIILSDVRADLVRRLTIAFAPAPVQQVDARALPFQPASLAHVLGLCIFDVLPEAERVVAELGRVLVPGGSFMHFLDLGTSLEPVFASLVGSGKVPLPNFFDEHVGAAGLSPLVDLLAVPHSTLNLVVSLLQRARHPAAGKLVPYLSVFGEKGFDARNASRYYVRLLSNPPQARELKRLLLGVHRVVEQPSFRRQVPWQLDPVESSSLFRERLRATFGAAPQFLVEQDELIAARAWVPLEHSGMPAGCCYHGRFLGIEHLLPEPLEASCVPVEVVEGRAAEGSPEGAWFLREVVVHAFVARRI